MHRPAVDQVFQFFRLQFLDFLEIQFDPELVLDPADRASQAKILAQKSGAVGQIDVADRFAGPFDQVFGSSFAAHLAEVLVPQVQAPPRVGEFRQRQPVPFLRGLFVDDFRQILFDGVQDLSLGVLFRFVPGKTFRLGKVHSAEIAGFQRGPQPLAGPFGERLDAEVPAQVRAQMVSICCPTDSRISSRQLAPSRIRWR